LEKHVPSVTILILNFNGRRHLAENLESVLATDYSNFEVIVVDNNSSDGSVEFLNEKYPDVRVLRHNRNLGFSRAYNKALSSVNTEYFALLNNDVSVEPSWLATLISYVEKDRVAALTPKMLLLRDRRRINAAGGNCDVYGTGWNRGNSETDRGQYDKSEETFYGNGGALLIRKQVWQEVGTFDEHYFMYGEDLDWCWRARLRGYRIIYVPESRVYHSWLGSKGKIFYFLERHWLSNVLKNYTLQTLFKIMPRYIIIKLLKMIWVFKNAKPDNKFFVPKAILWNLKHLKKTWEKRVKVQNLRDVSDSHIQRLMFKKSFELLLRFGNLSHPALEKV
jgi:GT2 family glycosyltransferase